MHIQMQILHDLQCWHQVQKTQNIFILFFKVLIWRVSFSIIDPFKF